MPLTYVQDYAGVISRSLPDLALLLNATTIDAPADPLDDVANGHRPADWTPALKTDALVGKVIGVPASAFLDPFGTTGTSRRDARAVRALRRGGRDGQGDHRPAERTGRDARATRATRAGASGSSPTRTTRTPTRRRSCARRCAPAVPQHEPVHGHGRDDAPSRSQAFQTARANYRVALAAWMDAQGVDAVVFPGQLSDIHLNDSIQPSFGRRDPQASAAGVPNVIFPAGVNDHGQPINLQLQGKEFDDLKLLGMRLRVRGQGQRARRVLAVPEAAVRDVDRRDRRRQRSGDARVDARRARLVRRVRAGRGSHLRRVHLGQRDLHGGRRGADGRRREAVQRRVHAAASRCRSRSRSRPGARRCPTTPVTIALQAAHRRHRAAPHRRVLEDADVHAVDDDAVDARCCACTPASSGRTRARAPCRPARTSAANFE